MRVCVKRSVENGFPEEGMWTCMTSARQLEKEKALACCGSVLAFVESVILWVEG
jgi:hypothetical protein